MPKNSMSRRIVPASASDAALSEDGTADIATLQFRSSAFPGDTLAPGVTASVGLPVNPPDFKPPPDGTPQRSALAY
jgi:hypothetical protein